MMTAMQTIKCCFTRTELQKAINHVCILFEKKGYNLLDRAYYNITNEKSRKLLISISENCEECYGLSVPSSRFRTYLAKERIIFNIELSNELCNELINLLYTYYIP